MSTSEVLWRIAVAFRSRVDAVRHLARMPPLPSQRVGRMAPLFEWSDGWESVWRRLFELDERRLNRMLSGKLEIFDTDYDLGVLVDWHRDPMTGLRAPQGFSKTLDYRDEKMVGNIKVLWELGRHQHLTTWAVAFAITGDPRYSNAIAVNVDSWIDQNPYCHGVHWTSSLEVALRLMSWSFCHAILSLQGSSEGLFQLVDGDKLGASIYQQCRFVQGFHSRYSSANNHLIGELVGLYVACNTFDLGKEGTVWRNRAATGLIREARLQVYSDGVSKEQSTYYHLWVLEYLLIAATVSMRRGDSVAGEIVPVIQKMRTFLEDLTPLGGTPPAIGDSDDGAATRFEPGLPNDPYVDVLAAVDRVVGGCLYQKPLSQKAFWYAWLGKGNCSVAMDETIESKSQLSVYPDAGYGILRGGSTHVVFDAGALGFGELAAHGHADALSICLAVNGRWFLVDPGTYCYHDQPRWRDYFRGTAAHNTVRVDGQDQATVGGPFLWSRKYDACIVESGFDEFSSKVSGIHDGYRVIGCTHRRTLVLDHEGVMLQITDYITGKGPRKLELFLHMAPEVEWELLDQGSLRLTLPGMDRGLLVQAPRDWLVNVEVGSLNPISGWFSHRLGHKEPAPTMVARYNGGLPCEAITKIAIVPVGGSRVLSSMQ